MSFYDEIEIEDMTYHEATTLYTYPCPCGDQFEISLDDLRDGEEVAVCPSCSLQIRVIFEAVRLRQKIPNMKEVLILGCRKISPKTKMEQRLGRRLQLLLDENESHWPRQRMATNETSIRARMRRGKAEAEKMEPCSIQRIIAQPRTFKTYRLHGGTAQRL